MTSISCGLVGTPLLVGLLLTAMASIQSDASLARGMFPLVGARGIMALWLLFAVLTLLLFLHPWRKRLSLQPLRSVVVYSTALGGTDLLFYLSAHTVPPGIAVALEFAGPLLVAILSLRRLLDFLWIGLVVFDIWPLLSLGSNAEPSDLVGTVYVFSAGVCWALYILFNQRVGADHGAQGATLGALVAVVLAVPIGVAHIGAGLPDPTPIPSALGVAVLSTTLPYTLEMVALTRLLVRTLDTLMSIEPILGTLPELLFLGERLDPAQWLAIGVIILTLVGAILSVKSHDAAPALLAED